ncbi:MAG TPA: hydrogen gas-evolving membrane-bound hydrogenase subunit E [Spirochaetia bacterium]|nr:hydrogen gas-evolving membrane-bound hydrogenase subunit E [Spirochaetia bacterium]
MGVEIYLIVLLVFMIFGALIAVEMKSLLSSVIALGAIGFGSSIAFLFLGAPDLAIVQIAVEVLFLIFLIRATISRDIVSTTGHIRWYGLIVAVCLIATILVFGIFAFRDLNDFGTPIISVVKEAPSNEYLAKGLKETGSANIVTAVLLDYRAFDTLGEATVIFAAIIGALAILRGRAK